MYYNGFSFSEAYNLPVWQRTWFIDRVIREMKASAESSENESMQSRAAHLNSPEQRAFNGNQRNQVPSRLRRFT